MLYGNTMTQHVTQVQWFCKQQTSNNDMVQKLLHSQSVGGWWMWYTKKSTKNHLQESLTAT